MGYDDRYSLYSFYSLYSPHRCTLSPIRLYSSDSFYSLYSPLYYKYVLQKYDISPKEHRILMLFNAFLEKEWCFKIIILIFVA